MRENLLHDLGQPPGLLHEQNKQLPGFRLGRERAGEGSAGEMFDSRPRRGMPDRRSVLDGPGVPQFSSSRVFVTRRRIGL